ncbi:hypothetical protein SGM_4699 [Streptomyces griseoaurantiacus M045]|uniref:Uncharacterized protein n=1 Tax=Streptomyces griseoaurantiacus M045 TaxID=996637 RepID=F3NNI5_9ACTN|nr:hypothetical protein SGM_4699 [Streptomyces griseoaurantiacus M045]
MPCPRADGLRRLGGGGGGGGGGRGRPRRTHHHPPCGPPGGDRLPVILFLVRADSSFVTGWEPVIDGGLTAH